MKILSSFTLPHAIPNVHDFVSSVEHKLIFRVSIPIKLMYPLNTLPFLSSVYEKKKKVLSYLMS